MKLFSRKALVSVATATALTAGSLSAPAFAQETTGDTNNVVTTETTQGSADSSASSNTDTNTVTTDPAAATSGSSASDLFEGSSDPETGKLDTKQIAAWISLVGTVISVLTAAVTFAAKVGALTK